MASAGARDFGSIRKLPSGRWQARYRAPDGERRTAPTTFTTKKAASAWLADVQSDIERNRWKSPEQVAAEEAEAAAARAETLTVSQLAEVWLETIPSENHRVISVSRVRRFINPELGHIPIDELTKERCDQWYRDMNTTLCPGAPTQVRRTFAALHAMLKLAVHEDWIPVSPLRIKGALIDTPAREPRQQPSRRWISSRPRCRRSSRWRYSWPPGAASAPVRFSGYSSMTSWRTALSQERAPA